MTQERAILSIKYTPASNPRTVHKAVGGFLRYVQYRDHHQETETDPKVSGLLKYVAHRDRSSERGLLFDRRGRAGEAERTDLAAYVARSVHGLDQRQRANRRPPRAVYRLVLSPERAQGLDLQRLTRAVMNQLERDIGRSLPPWVAAEHRNTKHPHVHIVMAARDEIAPGRFRGINVTRERLRRMKLGLEIDLGRQREGRPMGLPLELARDARQRSQPRPRRRLFRMNSSSRLLRRLADHYRREAEREARERGWEWER